VLKAEIEMDARRRDSRAASDRLHRLELHEQHVAAAEAAGLASTRSLEQRVRGMEVKLAAATQMLGAGDKAARETQAGVAALTWRLDQVGTWQGRA
jgi:hypothetical protein